MRSPYVVCRLSVTLLRRAHSIELYGNVFAPTIRLGNSTVCIETLEKIQGV